MKKLITPLVFGFFITNANAQQIDAQTGNIVYVTSTNNSNPPPNGDWTGHSWSGFVGTSSNGGGFSGGNVPGWNSTTGTFIFGYTQRTISYTTSVNMALANAGTNIQINGFKYSWQYYNQDMSRGTLTGNIGLTNSSGQIIESYNYNMPKTTSGWTTMSGTQNFPTQYALSNVGNLQVSFTGKDDRFWAGYYGPQIRSIDVSMLYSVPAPPPPPSPAPSPSPSPVPTTNTSSPTTAAVNEAIAASTSIEQPVATVTTTSTTTDTTTSSGSPSSSPVVSSPVATTSPTTTSTSSTSSTTTSTSTASVATTSPSSGGSRTVDGTGIGLSVVSRNAQREQAISMQAAQSAVAAAEQTAQQAQQEAVSVAQASSTNSVSFSSSPVAKQFQSVAKVEQTQQTSTSQLQSSSTVSSFQPNAQQTRTTENRSASFSLLPEQAPVVATQSMPAITQVNNLIISQPVVSTPIISAEQPVSTQVSTSLSLLPPVTPQQIQTAFVPFIVQETKDNNQSVPTFSQSQTIFNNNDLQTSESQKLLTDKTNPINQIIESRPELQSSQTVQQKTTVNTNASDNEISGGVGLARMATTPPGYAQYLNLMIADASFYAPKEIYKGQRTVDNVRALRAMSSDRLHQQMVDSQYERK